MTAIEACGFEGEIEWRGRSVAGSVRTKKLMTHAEQPRTVTLLFNNGRRLFAPDRVRSFDWIPKTELGVE